MSSGTTSSSPVTFTDLVDRRRVGRLQYGVLTLCGLVMFIDGFDTQAISYMAPSIAREWGLSAAALGPVFSSALVGLMVGYLVLSPLAERVGCKRVLVVATALFSVFTLASMLVSSVVPLLVLRFLTGLGLGAAAPSAISLTSEFAPRRLRATFVLVIYCGFSLGFVVAGLAAGALIPAFGWRSLFLVGGLVPLLLVPALLRHLPESVAFRLRRRRSVAGTLRRLDPELSDDVDLAAEPANAEGRSPLRSLFTRRWVVGTLLLWLVFVINLAEFYALQSWLPTILNRLQYPTSAVVAATTLTTVGGIAAALVTGPAMDRLGAAKTLGVLYLVGFVFVGVVGFALDAPLWVLLAANFLAGCCVSGGQKSVIAFASVFYPPSLRSTGVGWALGIGRIGGIFGPIVVGLAISAQWAYSSIFYVLAIPMLLASLAVFALRRRGADSEVTISPGRAAI
ncbi:MFS transporter [Actinomycetospora soli]|uniref:MFS transporter n=1 Tax=Actinomycetospora soli TaxID=2893887 RepID=UPI001E2886D1|nr:MFS transporter [Actinomycetospora soli]MCD2191577.1 MFS transporter [Actinomycetospora soli]